MGWYPCCECDCNCAGTLPTTIRVVVSRYEDGFVDPCADGCDTLEGTYDCTYDQTVESDGTCFCFWSYELDGTCDADYIVVRHSASDDDGVEAWLVYFTTADDYPWHCLEHGYSWKYLSPDENWECPPDEMSMSGRNNGTVCRFLSAALPTIDDVS